MIKKNILSLVFDEHIDVIFLSDCLLRMKYKYEVYSRNVVDGDAIYLSFRIWKNKFGRKCNELDHSRLTNDRDDPYTSNKQAGRIVCISSP